jgi:DNA-binding response OmpR family regulator
MTKTRALIVEDDPIIVPGIRDALVALHHESDVAMCQQEAEALLAQKVYDYVLLDLAIPVTRESGGASAEYGILLLRSIRAEHDQSQLPVIVVTARGSECVDRAQELLRIGANALMSKSWGRPLTGVISDVLQQRVTAASWLTVTEAATLLCQDVPGLDLKGARARVSWAAGAGKFRTNGEKGPGRRIDPTSFNSWRLQQRDIDLDRTAAL